MLKYRIIGSKFCSCYEGMFFNVIPDPILLSSIIIQFCSFAILIFTYQATF